MSRPAPAPAPCRRQTPRLPNSWFPGRFRRSDHSFARHAPRAPRHPYLRRTVHRAVPFVSRPVHRQHGSFLGIQRSPQRPPRSSTADRTPCPGTRSAGPQTGSANRPANSGSAGSPDPSRPPLRAHAGSAPIAPETRGPRRPAALSARASAPSTPRSRRSRRSSSPSSTSLRLRASLSRPNVSLSCLKLRPCSFTSCVSAVRAAHMRYRSTVDSSTLLAVAAKQLLRDAARRIFPRQRCVQPRFETAQNLVAIDQTFFSRDTASQASGPVNCRFGFSPSSNETSGCFGSAASNRARVRQRGSRNIS